MKSYPEHEKQAKILPFAQRVGEFIEWLGEQGIQLAAYHEHTAACACPEACRRSHRWHCDTPKDVLYSHNESIQSLLARFFEIDLKKIEAEKDAMLKELRHEA